MKLRTATIWTTCLLLLVTIVVLYFWFFDKNAFSRDFLEGISILFGLIIWLVAEVSWNLKGLRQNSDSAKTLVKMTKGVRKRSEATLWGLPLVSIATGPDPEHGELRGHARGVIAIGDIATGIIAIGGLARGVIAIGGLAIGVIALGGCALSLLLAVGGFAVGALAFGGAAIGGIAVGGCAIGFVAAGQVAIGYYAYGDVAIGVHTMKAVEFFGRFIPGLKQ